MGKRINTLNTASSPANDDYLPIDGATNGTRKISADFVNNLITDVEVDGTSVVTSGVAEIDLSGKQDTLTAGSNIQIAQDGTISATDTTYTAGTNVQIDNGVISATDTTYTAGTGIDITNGVISSNVTPGSTVSVTQKTSTGTNIADITVDGVTTQLYAPNGGGGGSSVIPNPTGTATDTLSTIEIDGTIYSIEGGGSGSGTTTEEIYKNTAGTIPDTINLTKPINDFDIILITGFRSTVPTWKISSFYVSSAINQGDVIELNDDAYYAWYTVTDLSTLTKNVVEYDVIDAIYGLKLGSGGGGGGTYTSTLLNDGTAVQDVLTLSSDYTNFDELLITWTYDNNLYITTLKLNTSNISINDTITLNDYSSRDMVLTVTSTTTFTITSQASGMGILSIRGLTYSKIAKEKSRDVLWTTGSWTMAHPITDYDEIIFKWGSTHSTCFIPSDIMTYESFIVINPDNDNFMWFDVTDASSFTVHQDNALTITSIEGVIYTKSEPTVFAEEMTQSEYDALPDLEKNNGCIYMVSSQASTPEELTEAQTNTSTAVTASSYMYDTNLNQYHYPWCAFNRVSPNPNEMAYPTPGVTTQTCWTPNVSQDGDNSWICYHFDRAYKMTSMTINSFTDYDSSATKSMVIEGSNDGTTWTNILLTGNSFSLDSYLHTLTPNNVNLNSDIAYEYVRLRSLEPMGASYQPSVFIDEIFVYGYKSEKALKKIYYMGTEYGNTGSGSSAIQLTQAEYDALTQEEKENGTIYFVATTTSQLIPRVSGTDSAITSSGKTRYNGGENWHAFDGVEDISGIANCWVADEDNTSAYIQYHFSQPYYLTQLQLKLYSHYSGAWTGTLNVLGSNDGSNWTNISSTGQAVNVTAPLNGINTEVIDLNSNNAWDYIRVQANGTAFNIAYQPCCDFSEIYVYGSSTPIVVENHDIYYMGDKYTNNSGGGVVMTGATSSVNGTQGEAPQPLAGDQEKVLTGAGTWTSLNNIGTSQIYLGDLIPRVTSSDTHITASSEGTYGSTIWSAWGALTTDISIQNVPASNSAWVNANGDSAPWIMYYFDEPRYFTEVEIKAFSNYGSDFSGTIYIEASNDASAWTDIGGGAKTINAALSTLTTNTYSISNNNSWRYIRIRGIQSFFELNEPACFFQSLQVKGGKVGGGIVQYIDFSSLSSQQVEDLQNKIGGSSQRTYLGQLIPRVSAADYKITASTSNSNYSAWGAFNGTSPSNLSNPEANSCWLPEANLTNQYIQYHFDAPRYFTKINIYCFSNYSTNWVGDIKIEGSSDGSTWENILASGDSTYELTAGYQSITNVEINLNDTDLWEYIRVTFVDEMSIAYQPSCFIDEIYVYGGSSGGENTRFESTELLSSTISTGGTYTLEDALENYDFVTIVSGASHESDIRTVAVEDILNTLSDGIIVNLIGASDRWVNITACSGTSITIAMNAPYIHSIKGYKLVGGGGSSSHTYSTTEQKVGTWIDGSDVWEKTINIEETTTHADTPFTIDIETNVGVLIEHSLMYRDSSFMNGRWNPLDGYTQQINDDMYYNRLYLESNGTLKSYFAGSLGVVTICGVIRYTKVSAS